LIGCGLPLLREGWPSALHVAVGMIPRGEVALIVAVVGLQPQIVTQSRYAIAVAMTAVTTLRLHRSGCATCSPGNPRPLRLSIPESLRKV